MNTLENKIENFNKDLAMILAKLAYHISPEIVNYISQQNIKEFEYFKRLFGENIKLENYLFDGSSCVFPGVRRYVSMKGEKRKYNKDYKAIVDDNVFPRHIWCFLINGKSYSGPNWKETKLDEFELAHIFTHKESEVDNEINFFEKIDEKIQPYGEFTCTANVVLLPKGTVRPTDNSPILKSIFYKRYIELYGENTLGGRTGFKDKIIPEWYYSLEWNKPFLPDNWKYNINKLLDYRKKRITLIMKNI